MISCTIIVKVFAPTEPTQLLSIPPDFSFADSLVHLDPSHWAALWDVTLIIH